MKVETMNTDGEKDFYSADLQDQAEIDRLLLCSNALVDVDVGLSNAENNKNIVNMAGWNFGMMPFSFWNDLVRNTEDGGAASRLGEAKFSQYSRPSHEDTALHLAVMYVDIETVKILLKDGANLYERNIDGSTPFHIAIQRRQNDIVCLFLQYDQERKKDIDATDIQIPFDYGVVSVHVRKKQNHETVANIRKALSNGKLPLFLATESGNIELIEMLLQYGADLSLVDLDGNGVLHVAVTFSERDRYKYSHGFFARYAFSDYVNSRRIEDIIRLFLEKGADINLRNHDGQTPLMIAAENGSSQFIELLLLDDKLDLNLRDRNGETALIKTAERCYRSGTDSIGYVEGLKLLLNRSVDVNAHDHRGFTALHAALHEKDFELYCLETACGGCYEHLDDLHTTDLNHCQMKDEIVELLLSSGADVNAKDFRGNTPLDIAYTCKALTSNVTLESLQVYGSESTGCPFITDNTNNKSNGRSHLQSYIIHKTNSLFIEESGIGFTKDDLASTHQDQRGRTALHYLFMYKPEEVDLDWFIEWLVNHPNHPTLEIQDVFGRTALHYATEELMSRDRRVYYDYKNDIKDKHGITARQMMTMRKQSYETQSEFEAVDKIIKTELHKINIMSDILQMLKEESSYGYDCILNINVQSSHKKLDYGTSVTWKCWTEAQYAYRNRITEGLSERLQEFITRLEFEIGKRDSRFECQSTLVGSAYEGTKIDLPTEFDFDFILTKLSKLCEVVSSNDVPNGYVHLKRKSSIIYHRESDELFDAGGFLLTTEISSIFQMLLLEILQDPNFWNNEPCFDWNLANETVFANGSHTKDLCMTITLNLHQPIDGEYFFQKISMDIVPCIHIDGYWPNEALSNISEDMMANGCNLVFDQAQRHFPLAPYNHPYARISFAPLESRIIAEAPRAAKAAYMVAKNMIKKQHKQTYIVKTCLLYCLEALRNNTNIEKCYAEVTSEELCFWVEKLFLCYLNFSLKNRFPVFVMPKYNLPIRFDVSGPMDDESCHEWVYILNVCLNVCLSASDNITIEVPPQAELDREEMINEISKSE